jgi:ribosomal protein L11 methyltransferase
MLAHTLLDAAPGLLARLAPGGALVLSGLLATDRARVESAFVPLATVTSRASGDWLAVHRA